MPHAVEPTGGRSELESSRLSRDLAPEPMAQLTGIRALVTGATSGLGRAMAKALGEAGARVAVTSRDRGRAAATAAEIGEGAIGVELDVRDVASVTRAVDEVYGAFRGLDLLVNNAGIGMRTVNPRFMTEPHPFYDVSPSGFRDVLETKVTGSFLVASAVARGCSPTAAGVSSRSR